jgi:Nitrile hydratase, alpha chain
LSDDREQVRGYQILQDLAVRAADDREFRRNLIDDPDRVLREAGIKIPQGVEVIVHENTHDQIHLVLPSCPPLQPDETNIVTLFCSYHVF